MENFRSFLRFVFRAIALATGISVLMMSLLKAGTTDDYILLLSIATVSLGLWAFENRREAE